jgi:hypothetical protein
MHALADAVKDDVARLQFNPIAYRRCIETCCEGNEDALRRQRKIGNARLAFLAAKNMKIWQFHSGQTRGEVATTGEYKFDFRSTKIGLVFLRIAENDGTDQGHKLCFGAGLADRLLE